MTEVNRWNVNAGVNREFMQRMQNRETSLLRSVCSITRKQFRFK